MVRVRARGQRRVLSTSLSPFSLIVLLLPPFVERQHHLLFASSIYSVNYIYLCSLSVHQRRPVQPSVNCIFIFFFVASFLRSFFFLFVSRCFGLCSPRAHIALAISYSARFAASPCIASRICITRRKARQPIGSVKLSVGPSKASGKFSNSPGTFFFRTLVDSAVARARVHGREITCSLHTNAVFHFSFISPHAARARELYITSLI